MSNFTPAELHAFIIQAKSATYVGGGAKGPSSRPGSHDLQFAAGDWQYLDSYFGGTDFVGEETIWHAARPVWVMNYYGYILQPGLITPPQAGYMIKASLSRLYTQNRFLGGFEYSEGEFTYIDTNEGDFERFTGREWIQTAASVKAYELVYHGGLIKD